MRTPGLNQPITYWPPTEANQYGVSGHDAPELIFGRWEDKNVEVTTQGGQVITSAGIIFVDRDLLVDGYLAKGDQSANPEPSVVPGAWKIRAYNEDPDLRSCTKNRKAVV